VPKDNAEIAPRPGRLVDRIADSRSLAPRQPFTWATWTKIAILGGMLVLINRHQFPLLVKTWLSDPNWGHGFLIPLFSIYLIYTRFSEIMSAKRKACLWGLALVIVAGALQIYPYRIQNPWTAQIGMVLLAVSLVFYLAGWQMFKYLWLPIFFLIFALPVSQSIYNSVAFKLQLLAAKWAAGLLKLFMVKVAVTGSTLFVTDIHGIRRALEVEEACSGIRLLMAFVALSVAMAYMAERPIWQRVILVLLGIPVAIACNILRVAITCSMFVIDKRQFGEKFMHEFTGMIMLIPAVAMLWLAGLFMNKLFIEEEIEPDQDKQAGPENVPVNAGEAS